MQGRAYAALTVTGKPGLIVDPVTCRTVYYHGASSLGLAPLRGFDVAPDGQRFLMIKEADQPGGQASLVVRLNVPEYLARLRSPFGRASSGSARLLADLTLHRAH